MAPERKINLVRAAHVYYTHKNIDKARGFLEDFGFQETTRVGQNTYYRGTGTEPFVYCATQGEEDSFDGAAFVVEAAEDLEYASQTLPGASAVEEMHDTPGGGRRVTFRDPVDGFAFHLVHGQSAVEAQPSGHGELLMNFVSTTESTHARSAVRFWASLILLQPHTKHRPCNQFQRFEKGETLQREGVCVHIGILADTELPGPAPVHKLGHFGLCVTDFAKTYEFYTTRFNFFPSDVSVTAADAPLTVLTPPSWCTTSLAGTSRPSCTWTGALSSWTTTASSSSRALSGTSTTLRTRLTTLTRSSSGMISCARRGTRTAGVWGGM